MCLWHLRSFFSVHCPRWNHCCVFSFHVLGNLYTSVTCPDLRLHFSALEQMSSYALLWGDPKIEFGKSDAVVLGTNAPTWTAESFHPWALESLNAWILESLNAWVLESLNPGGFESLTLWILGSGCGNLFFVLGACEIFSVTHAVASPGGDIVFNIEFGRLGGGPSRTPKTWLSFSLITCNILSVNSKTLSENRYWEGMGFWIQAAVNTRSTHSQHTVNTQSTHSQHW